MGNQLRYGNFQRLEMELPDDFPEDDWDCADAGWGRSNSSEGEALSTLSPGELQVFRGNDIGKMCDELDQVNRELIASPRSSKINKMLKTKSIVMDSIISDYRNTQVEQIPTSPRAAAAKASSKSIEESQKDDKKETKGATKSRGKPSAMSRRLRMQKGKSRKGSTKMSPREEALEASTRLTPREQALQELDGDFAEEAADMDDMSPLSEFVGMPAPVYSPASPAIPTESSPASSPERSACEAVFGVPSPLYSKDP